MNVNLEYYKIFYYVAGFGSFTKAAEELCISQPAVSQGIKLLETNLGSNLFVRTQKGVKLTPEGEVLYSYISRGYETILLGETKFKKMIDLENGEIRIGASDMTLQFYLLSFLEAFHTKYPGIKVTVTNAPTPETLEYLYDGKIDFGVVSAPFFAKSEIISREVKAVEDIFVAGSRFSYLKDQVLEYSDLEKLPIICLESNTSTRMYIDEILRNNGVLLNPEFELATSDMIVQFTLRNLGIGSVVSNFAEKFLDSGELFRLKFRKQIPGRSFCIITSDKNPISTAARELLDLMK
ncbi:LysR family transcriptional regulator [Anaerocolumna sp. AGMB13025]|uniref:LysR family transcriptional regulator n=1 Tax=Anaerocolumna sp. AGMB13025 TaxID=3039116 RepID=UPI00241FF1C6|nr:LysR family transcriptional regulator [Anaerocolumna sp. AGMB13025]WFR58302.1 LysR family transcriptional regulator [Anaerocolumna sp. AGMB13025]